MILIPILIIALVSIVLSFWSLRNLKTTRETRRVQKELSQERVAYHKESSSGSDSEDLS